MNTTQTFQEQQSDGPTPTDCSTGGPTEMDIRPATNSKTKYGKALLLLAVLMSTALSGCTSILSPIDTVPAERVPPQFLARAQSGKVPIDVARLRQPKPENYILDADDVLGVFIEGVLGGFEEAPPVQLPPQGSDLPPAIGYPVPLREDGTVSLPLVPPIPLRGLTIQQAEQLITRAYREGPEPILKEDGRIIVTLLAERTYRVFVVRQDNSAAQRGGQFQGIGRSGVVTDRSDLSSRGFVLQLPAYKNDVLNALAQTGGLPGLNAKPEIRVLRGDRISIANRDRQLTDFYRTNRPEDFPYGTIPNVPDETNTIRIPMRLAPGEVPAFELEDVILRDGDIVYVDSRESEVYYTGGLLGGGEFPLPRDYDLDVLGAVSLARVGVGVGQQQNGLFGTAGSVPPSELIILRRIPGDRQLAIRVDLNEAINDPRQRMLIRPADTLILRYKPQEEFANFALGTFFTFGVRRLFN